MKNKILYIFLFIILNNFVYCSSNSAEQFNFDVTEIEILKNGNVIKGTKKGTIKTNNGMTIAADTFIYDKILNILTANGNVEIEDFNNNLKIYSNNIIYQKDKEIINANGKVKIENYVEDYLITTDDLTYFKQLKKIITEGKTKALIKSKYNIETKDVIYLINENNLSSKKKTRVSSQNSEVYFVEKFNYLINQEIFKGEEILVVTNYNLPNSDKIFIKNGIVDLKNQKFFGKDTEITIHKNIFNNSENDPRLKGVSSYSDSELTLINKGVFTSCKKNEGCSPWSIQAKKIKHNKKSKQLIYDNAVLKIYDFPVLYFPKFFHPDPSVSRQSGILTPVIHYSSALGSSLTLPYFKVVSENKDLTLTPTLFENDTIMSVAEYRQVNKNSNLLMDIGIVKGYKSTATNKKNNLSHLFLDFDLDLGLENYLSSDLSLSIEKVSNDTYLKVFDSHITNSGVRPKNFDKLNSNIKINLNHENYNFETGVQSYKNLQVKKKSDQYQYVLPYYNFDRTISQDYLDGNINFNSSGSNDLRNTNSLETNVINNLTYQSLDSFSNLGFKNNFSINLQNLNSIGKKTTQYKSSPQIELATLFNIDLSLPLSKKGEKYNNLLTPKLSFRFSPNDMKNYSSSDNKIDVNNIFAINRLGFSDTLEAGRSLTLGLDFSKENKDDLDLINNYFELKLATVLRDKEETFIPNKSTIHRKNSNLFGSITNKFSDNVNLSYNFSLDNDYNTLEYSDFNATFSINNFVTKFNFIEESGETGGTNILANSTTYNLDNKNFFKFETRRNKKLNLTEYYDLVYEYRNDCLTAGIKYKKSYYSDGDLKPSENLLFTITLIPLTSYEYKANELLSQ